jgi:6-phosphogluconolactonase|eukprot:COSAG02_NODE_53_length_44062_cov_22.860223_8_plen_403_part_00
MGVFLYSTLYGEDALVWYRVDEADRGELELCGSVPLPGHGAGIGSSPDGRTLYVATHDTGRICSFKLDSAGRPLPLHVLDTGLEDPAYLATDLKGQHLIVPFYRSGCVATFPLGNGTDSVDDGSETGISAAAPARRPASCVVRTARHAHGVAVGPTNRHIFIPHAGGTWPGETGPVGDAVYQFSLSDDDTGQLIPHSTVPTLCVRGGDRTAARALGDEVGPRHLRFRPDFRFAYSSNEQDNSATCYSYDRNSGRLAVLQTVSSHPDDFDERGTSEHSAECAAARLVIHPSGKWLVVANRGHNSLAVFAIDEHTGWMTRVGCTTVDATPRSFDFEPGNGRFLYSAGEECDTITCLCFDVETGSLEPMKRYGTGRHPWWVEVVVVPEDEDVDGSARCGPCSSKI